MSRRVGLRFRGKVKPCLVSVAAGSLALSLLALGWTAQVAAQGMALPGKFEVTAGGAADYTISIAVPPGTGGMVPSIALSYNSQGRNGLVGVGWQLEGLPSIGRCAWTYAQDWARGGVNYDGNDRFCLDGQRLVAISGAYGADGTEYRTEIESFSKIISRGTAGTGPAWFEVWTKTGQRMEFGNTTDSRVLAQGKTTARDWVVNKVSDTKGNYFTVTYVNDTTNGQVYPSRIDYTGNTGTSLAPYNSVRFVYNMARPDVVPAYNAGSLMKTTVLLVNVQSFMGSTLVADYRLAYDQSPTTGRSRLTSVTLCEGGGVCLPATTFAWQSGTDTTTVVANPGGQNGTLSGYRPNLGDFNGDGLLDIMWDQGGHATSPTSTGTRVLWTGTAGGNFAVTSNFAGQDGTLSGYGPLVADFDRDGRSDVWWFQMNTNGSMVGPTTQWLSTNAGTYQVRNGPTAPAGNQYITVRLSAAADVNGDGRVDIFWPVVIDNQYSLSSWITQPDLTVVSHGQDGCGYPPGGCGGGPLLGTLDFNGDGLSDILWRNSIWRGLGDGAFSTVQGQLSGYSPNVVDVNSDGKSDILWDKVDSSGRSNGQRVLWLSKGDGTFVEQSNFAGQDGTLAGYRPYAIDANGDGLADILWVQSDTNGLSTGARVLWRSKADGTFTVVSNFAGQDGTLVGYVPIMADFNGDGKTDILWDSRSATDTRSTGTRVLWLSDGLVRIFMTSITSGIGTKITVTYKSMTDSTVYTKDSTATDPLVDVQGPMSVVSRVDSDNGVGGTISTGYAYAGAKAHLDGRGFLGFRQMKVTDLQTSIVQTTSYRQSFPLVGLVESESKTLGTQTLSQATHSYQFLNASGGTTVSQTGAPYRVSLTQSVASGSDLDGSPLPAVTSTYQHDTYGNPTRIAVAASDGHGKTTINTYTNDTTKWLLGRLTRASVKSCPPGGSCAGCSLPWGGQIVHGSTVTAYRDTKSALTGCVSETRTCIDGSLSGSYQFATCAPYTPASMVFNGTNQALVRTLSTTSPSSVKFTYSFWVKPAGYDSKGTANIMQVINAPTNSQWTVIGLPVSGSRLQIDQTTPNWGKAVTATPALGTGAWHHVVFVYDSTIGPVQDLGSAFRISIYQNGVAVPTFTQIIPKLNAVHTLFTNGRQHQIGGWLDVSRFFKGKLAFIDVIQDMALGPEAFGFKKNGVWTRRPHIGPHGAYGFSLDGSTGLGKDVGPNGQDFTGLNMTDANLDPSDLPPHDADGWSAGLAATAQLKGAAAPAVSAASSKPQEATVSGNHAPMR